MLVYGDKPPLKGAWSESRDPLDGKDSSVHSSDIVNHTDGSCGEEHGSTDVCLCLSVCMHECSMMISGKPFILGSEDQRSRSQRLCRSSDRTQYCRCICKPQRVFLVVMSCHTSHASNNGFSLCHFPASTCWLQHELCMLGFPQCGFL